MVAVTDQRTAEWRVSACRTWPGLGSSVTWSVRGPAGSTGWRPEALLVGEVVLSRGRTDLHALGRLGLRDEDLRWARQPDAVAGERLEEELAELAPGRPLLRRAD